MAAAPQPIASDYRPSSKAHLEADRGAYHRRRANAADFDKERKTHTIWEPPQTFPLGPQDRSQQRYDNDNDNDNDTLREVQHLSDEGLALQARV